MDDRSLRLECAQIAAAISHSTEVMAKARELYAWCANLPPRPLETKAETEQPAPKIIPPTVGRIVWYRPARFSDAGMAIYDWLAPLAATVAYVWSDTCVNLDVVDHSGAHHQRTSVTLHQGDGPCACSPFAEWMPYQRGQAAKTEALERKLADGERPSAGALSS